MGMLGFLNLGFIVYFSMLFRGCVVDLLFLSSYVFICCCYYFSNKYWLYLFRDVIRDFKGLFYFLEEKLGMREVEYLFEVILFVIVSLKSL